MLVVQSQTSGPFGFVLSPFGAGRSSGGRVPAQNLETCFELEILWRWVSYTFSVYRPVSLKKPPYLLLRGLNILTSTETFKYRLALTTSLSGKSFKSVAPTGHFP